MTQDTTPRYVELLGHFSVRIGGEHQDVPRQAQRVLTLLAMETGRWSRTRIAARLWTDKSASRALAALRNAVWRLRNIDNRLLEGDRHWLGLGATVQVDVRVARSHAAAVLRGEADAADPDGLISLFERDLLPTWDEIWLTAEQERHRQMRIHALEALSAALERAGRTPEAISAALAAIHAEPLRESAHRVLIRAHISERNVSEAVRQLHHYGRMLREELGMAPSRDLEAMVWRAVDESSRRDRMRPVYRRRSTGRPTGRTASGGPFPSPHSYDRARRAVGYTL